MFPIEILEIVALSTYEAKGLSMTFGLRKLLNYGILDKFVRMENKQYILSDGKKHTPLTIETNIWWRYGKKHRDGDKPAAILKNIGQYLYKNGEKHRDGDKPAIIFRDGSQIWYKEGKRHRDSDLPAIIHRSESSWWKNGVLHREGNLPAIVRPDLEEWYTNGKLIKSRDINVPH
jgi:hypothetical protein